MVETVSRQGLSQGVFPCYMCPWEPHDLMGTRWICYGHMGATRTSVLVGAVSGSAVEHDGEPRLRSHGG